jgi:hypothetical protein
MRCQTPPCQMCTYIHIRQYMFILQYSTNSVSLTHALAMRAMGMGAPAMDVVGRPSLTQYSLVPPPTQSLGHGTRLSLAMGPCGLRYDTRSAVIGQL